MISGLLGFLAANAAAALGAVAIVRRIGTGRPCVDVVLVLLVRLLLISTAVAAAGWTGLLRSGVLGLAGVAALAALLAAGVHRGLPRVRRPDASPWVLGLLGFAALRLLAQTWFFSPHLGDALAYHLPKVAEWVRAGAFTREMGLHPHVTFPAGFELVETWWVVFLRHDVLIEMAGVEFLGLAFAATFALARWIGLPERGAWLAATAYLLCPGLHLSATSCLNDAAAASLVVATAALVAWRVHPALALTAVALGAGIKATALYPMAGIAGLAFLVRKEESLPCGSPRGAVGLAAAAMAVGGSWFVRNWAWFGYPAYPVGSPGYESSPVAVQAGPRGSSLIGNARALLDERIADRAAALGANVDYMAGWGALAFSLGLIALPLVMRSNPRFRRLGAAFLGGLACSLLLVIHDPWCLKYVFYFPAVLAVGAVALIEAAPALGRIAAVAIAVDVLASTLPYDLPASHLAGLARQPWSTRSALQADLPPGEPIGCFGGYPVPAYLLYGADFGRRVVYLRASTADELHDAMRREGITRFYARPTEGPDESIVRRVVETGLLVPEADGVYRRASE